MTSQILTHATTQSLADMNRGQLLELALFRRLRPRIHPWVQMTPFPDGGAELYDFLMSTRLHLNQMAYEIVKNMRDRNQTLEKIAVELAARFDENQHNILVDAVKVYKELESYDAVAHPPWRYAILYIRHVRNYFYDIVKTFIYEYFRGLGGGW